MVAPVALLLWMIVGTGDRWGAGVRGAVTAAAALPLLFPWLGVISAPEYVRAGEPAFWSPSPVWAAALGVAVLGAVVAGDRLLSGVAGWGGLVALAGAGAARSGDFGSGTEVELAGLVAAAVGSAVVAGAAIEVFRRLDVPGWRRTVAGSGAAAAMVVAVAVVPFVLPGRAGLPDDRYRDLLEFTTASAAHPSRSRVLLIGSADSLPGEARSLDGTAYRVTSAPVPGLWEAHLGVERQADAALEGVLRTIVGGETARAGEALAGFGIEWVVFAEETVLDVFFAGQLDLLPLPGLDETAFVNDEVAVRAAASSGEPWDWIGPAYRGERAPGEAVRVAEAADQRWGPAGWAQAGWANEMSAATGEASFSGRPGMRNEALAALAYLALLVALAVAGAGRRRG